MKSYPTCGDNRVLKNITAQLAAQFYRGLLSKNLGLLQSNTNKGFHLKSENVFLYVLHTMCQCQVSHRVFLLLVQREGRTQRHVGLRMERADWDGWIWPPRSTNGRLRGGGDISHQWTSSVISTKHCFVISFDVKCQTTLDWDRTIPSSSSRGE